MAENADKLVVIDFYAAWCGPCKIIGPKLLVMAEEFPEVAFAKIDVDENEETAEDCEIEGTITSLLNLSFPYEYF